MLIGDKIIASSSSVQQGDPHGPLLSALAVNDLVYSVKTPLSIWYLDDVTTGGPSEFIIDVYRKIVGNLCSISADVNTSKTDVVSYGTQGKKSFILSLNDAKIVSLCDSELSGSPLFEEAVLRIRYAKTEKLQLAIGRLMYIDCQTALFLLRHCHSVPKLLYTLRCSLCYIDQESLQGMDDAVARESRNVALRAMPGLL